MFLIIGGHMENTNEIREKYVVFEVYEKTVNIEPFVQYETFGEDLHAVYIKTKPKTVIKVTTPDSSWYEYDGNKVFVSNGASSYRTKASSLSTIAGSGWYTENDLKRIPGLRELAEGTTRYAYPVPLKKYKSNMLKLGLKRLNRKSWYYLEEYEDHSKILIKLGIIPNVRKKSNEIEDTTTSI